MGRGRDGVPAVVGRGRGRRCSAHWLRHLGGRAGGGSVVLGPGDYGVIPVGVPHAWSSEDDVTVRWAEMQGPQPRRRFDEDTFVVPSPSASAPIVLDVRDPRTRSFGNITRDHMDATKQSQGMLAVSAS